MKTFFTATVLILATGSAAAFDLSVFNEQEYYSGQAGSRLITDHANNPPELYRDGGFTFLDETQRLESDGTTVHSGGGSSDPSLYEEGNWPV